MSPESSPTLIESGNAADTSAPALPPANINLRIYPAAEIGAGDAFGRIIALSLILHSAIIIAALGYNLLGGIETDIGEQETILLNGIDVVILDRLPELPAPPIDVPSTENIEESENDSREEIAPPKQQISEKLPTEKASRPASETATKPISEEERPAEVDASQPETVKAPSKPVAEVLPAPPVTSPAVTPAAPIAPKSNPSASPKKPSASGKARLAKYQSRLVSHLRRHRNYPAAARRKRMTGTATVSFTINRNGRVVGVSLARRTGHSILDREALAMVRRASPFPKIPPEIGKSRLTIRAPIRFDHR